MLPAAREVAGTDYRNSVQDTSAALRARWPSFIEGLSVVGSAVVEQQRRCTQTATARAPIRSRGVGTKTTRHLYLAGASGPLQAPRHRAGAIRLWQTVVVPSDANVAGVLERRGTQDCDRSNSLQ